DLAVCEGAPCRNAARNRINAAMKLRHARFVDVDAGEIGELAAEECRDPRHGVAHLVRRKGLVCIPKHPQDAIAAARLRCSRKVDSDDTALAPRDGATADGSVEQGETDIGHGSCRSVQARLSLLQRVTCFSSSI